MQKRKSILFSAVSLLTLAFSAHGQPSPSPTPPICGGFCVYRGCSNGRRGSALIPEGPGRILQPRGLPISLPICRKKGPIFRAMWNVTVGEAQLARIVRMVAQMYQPASMFSLPNLIDPYPRKLFKPVSVARGLPPTVLSLITGLTGNQYSLLNNRCVRVPILQHQFRSSRGVYSKIFKRRRPRANECIEFLSLAPSLYIRLTWQSGDDLDLIVDEPNGFRIDLLSPFSPTGGSLSSDNGAGSRCSPTNLSEAIFYAGSDAPLSGRYTIGIRQTRSCGRNTKWILLVVQNGVQIGKRKGTLTGTNTARSIRVDVTF